MLHHAQGLAASPHALYKLIVGGARRLPFLFGPPRTFAYVVQASSESCPVSAIGQKRPALNSKPSYSGRFERIRSAVAVSCLADT